MSKGETSKERAQVGIIMGSDTDLPVMNESAKMLDKFSIPFEIEVVSAHRSPARTHEYATTAIERGLKVVIVAAGGAAHLVLSTRIGVGAHLLGVVPLSAEVDRLMAPLSLPFQVQLELTRPWWLLGLAVLPGLVYYFYRSLVDLSRWQRVLSLLLRGALVFLLILALGGLSLIRPTRELFVAFAVDRSESIGEPGNKAADDYVVAWVVQQSLGGHAIPLDVPTLRTARRLGLIDCDPDDMEAARSSLEHLVPKAKGALFCELISNLAALACW